MYAIISTGGKQLKVTNDEVVAVERLAGNAGDKVTFDQVLAVGEGANVNFGTPVVEGAKVEAEIVEHLRGPKLIAFKIKRKGYRLRTGHRQELTKVKILSVG